MIDEWTSDSSSDLCGFVPYIWKFNIQMMEGFEMIMVLNDKNWIDTRLAFYFYTLVLGAECSARFVTPSDTPERSSPSSSCRRRVSEW